MSGTSDGADGACGCMAARCRRLQARSAAPRPKEERAKQHGLPGTKGPLLDRAMLEERVKARGPPSPAAGRGQPHGLEHSLTLKRFQVLAGLACEQLH